MKQSNQNRGTVKKFTVPSLQQMEQSTPKPTITSHFKKKETIAEPEVSDLAHFKTSSTVAPATSSSASASPPTTESTKPSSAAHGSPVKFTEYKGALSGSPNRPQKASVITVNAKQKGNPILKHIRNVPWEFGDVAVDYELGKSTCALYLSLRYHNLHPEYVHARMENMHRAYELRVLLVQVDVKDPHYAIRELGRICILAGWTLMLCWSAEEAGRYLETYKAYENKPADVIMEKTDTGYLAEASDFLTAVKSINKTDAMTLLSTFKSIAGVMRATREELELCPGMGPSKAKRLYEALREPFLKSDKRKAEREVSTSPKKGRKEAKNTDS